MPLAAALLVGACGGSDPPSERVGSGAAVQCEAGLAEGARTTLAPNWVEGQRLSFEFTASKEGLEAGDWEASRRGQLSVLSADDRGFELDWQLADGVPVVLPNGGPQEFARVFGEEPSVDRTYTVTVATGPGGNPRRILNRAELATTAGEMIDQVSGGESLGEQRQALRLLLLSKLVEPALLMQAPYGLSVDAEKPTIAPSRFVAFPGEETIRVSEAETEGGCLEITAVAKPDARRVGSSVQGLAELFGQDAEVSALKLTVTTTVLYDTRKKLVRRVERLVEAGDSPGEVVRDRKTFMIHPVSEDGG